MRTVRLPSGRTVPALGQGTWRIGESRTKRREEVAALQLGIELGMTLVDTAEMYADGGAEECIAEAIAGRRDEVFLVSKVLPQNATRAGTLRACRASLKRLATDRIDLYLLHWRGSVPLEETLEAFQRLERDGLVREWGVSNFDVEDLDEWVALAGGDRLATNQVYYNLKHRGIEWDLIPWCRGRRIPFMPYSPIESSGQLQRRFLDDTSLRAVAARHGATAAQIALAWCLRHEDAIVIPKMGTREHVRENRAAADFVLGSEDLAELDRAFPPPRRRQALETV
jgi:diketogulonate reductase-like aldo/keto reductase